MNYSFWITRYKKNLCVLTVERFWTRNTIILVVGHDEWEWEFMKLGFCSSESESFSCLLQKYFLEVHQRNVSRKELKDAWTLLKWRDNPIVAVRCIMHEDGNTIDSDYLNAGRVELILKLVEYVISFIQDNMFSWFQDNKTSTTCSTDSDLDSDVTKLFFYLYHHDEL